MVSKLSASVLKQCAGIPSSSVAPGQRAIVLYLGEAPAPARGLRLCGLRLSGKRHRANQGIPLPGPLPDPRNHPHRPARFAVMGHLASEDAEATQGSTGAQDRTRAPHSGEHAGTSSRTTFAHMLWPDALNVMAPVTARGTPSRIPDAPGPPFCDDPGPAPSTLHLCLVAETVREEGVDLVSGRNGAFAPSVQQRGSIFSILDAVGHFDAEIRAKRQMGGIKRAKDRGACFEPCSALAAVRVKVLSWKAGAGRPDPRLHGRPRPGKGGHQRLPRAQGRLESSFSIRARQIGPGNCRETL